MPERIQLRRTKGYRKPEGAVVVSRPSKWGNPYLLGDVWPRFPSLTLEQCAGFVVNEFRDLIRIADGRYPSVEEIRAELAGKDLACWCPLGGPCHADVLLEIAHGEGESA
jgi:hypothetical protein